MLNKWVVKISFADYAANLVADIDIYHFQQHSCVTTDTFAVDCLFKRTCFFILYINQHYACKAVSLLGVYHISAVFKHFVNKSTFNVIENKYFLFSDTGQVVIKCASVDNILSRFRNIRSIVNNNRRISGSCAYRLFTG